MPYDVSIDCSADRKYRRSAMRTPMLEADREIQLATRWREASDENALHELTTAYMRLVISWASKFRNYGLPMSDLISEGNVGLMIAASRFDPERGVRFSTYASWWIRSSIQEYVLRNWSIVRTGTTSAQKSLFFNLRRLRARIGDAGGGIMDPANRKWVAEHLSVPEREVEAMASRLSASDRSLNAPLAIDGEGEWQDFLIDETARPEMQAIENADRKRYETWIERALQTLSPREIFIIRNRRMSDENATLAAIGAELGISKERVRQIEAQALRKLKKALENIIGDIDRIELLAS
jgi:RNA polymerase sigma-32 factor